MQVTAQNVPGKATETTMCQCTEKCPIVLGRRALTSIFLLNAINQPALLVATFLVDKKHAATLQEPQSG